jgi:hypothetical protein
MENSLKGLILAAGTIITCVVISLGFFISREAKQTASTGTNQIGKLNAEFAQSDKIIYDGAIVSGSEVINVVKKMNTEKIGIYIITKKSSTFYGYRFDLVSGEMLDAISSDTAEALIAGNIKYVNPYEDYSGKVVRDKNNMITGIVFSQS